MQCFNDIITRDIIERKACDFVVYANGKVKDVIQVCYQLYQNNMNREIKGALEAMEFFNLSESVIITHDQADTFSINNKTIKAIPFYRWATTKTKS